MHLIFLKFFIGLILAGYKQYEHCNIGAANFAHSLADKPKQMPKRLANTIFTSCASTLPKCSPSIDVLHIGHIKEHFSGEFTSPFLCLKQS